MSTASPTKIINQSALDDSKNLAVEVPTQMHISDIPTYGGIDQSTTLSTTGINPVQLANGESSPEAQSNLNFWHSSNPALVP
jgi:hypothetical protein